MGKGQRTLVEQVRETKNFAQLATYYRHIAKFRDAIQKSAASVPNNALDPTLKGLDDTLRQFRDAAKDITGEEVTHDQLMINWGDEFGAATPTTHPSAACVCPNMAIGRSSPRRR